jgi:hypothetical protein
LPPARAVLAVYPGRAIEGVEGPRLAEVGGGAIPARTRVLALASRGDTTVGTRWARRIVQTAARVPRPRRTLRLVTDPAAADHLAPTRADAAARRTFWAPLDALLRD